MAGLILKIQICGVSRKEETVRFVYTIEGSLACTESNNKMKVQLRHLLLLAVALIVRKNYLIQPLPSRLKVVSLSPSIAPKPSTLHFENVQSLDNAVKLFQGRFKGAGE